MLNLFWSDPLGGSANDYDVYLLDSSGTSVDASSTNPQFGSQDPYENINGLVAGERIVIVLSSGAARYLHLDAYLGQLSITTAGSTHGHNSATNAFGVAAVDIAKAYPNAFKGGAQNPVESFSSDGPRHVFFQANGTAITPGNFLASGGAIRQKPDFAAADGVATDLPGFNPFFGTSAAAPHAASIAALLKSYNPSLSPAQMRFVLTNTALDIMAPGIDRDSGAGIVMVPAALAAAFPDALEITPKSGPTFGGQSGKVFNASSFSYSLTNGGSAALTWSLDNPASWLKASATGGALAPGNPAVTVTLTLNTAVASNLAPGVYYASEQFTNVTAGSVQTRPVALVVQPPVAPNPTNLLDLHPIAYWHFNETSQPPSANMATNAGSLGAAGNGYVINDVTNSQPGIVGTSFRFTNPGLSVPYLGSHVDVPNNPALNPNGPFTVEFWVKPSQSTPDLFCPVCSLDPLSNSGVARSGWLFYQNSDGTWQFRVGGLAGYSAMIGGGTVLPGVWQHVAGVYDGVNAMLYVNGVLAGGPTTISGFNPNQLCPLRIGATTIPNRTFDGWLDELAVYGRALSADEIAAHASAATTNNGSYAAQILAAGPVGYWPLNEPPYVAPDPHALPVAFNSGGNSNIFGLYEPGSRPGGPGVPAGGTGFGNYAPHFNGAAGYVEVPGAILNGITSPVTVLAWSRSTPNGTVQTLLSAGDTAFRLNVDAGGLPHFSDGLQASGDIVGGGSVADGQWHLLVGTSDGAGSENLYVDGQPAASTTSATTPIVGNTGDTWIGAAPDYATTRVFNGDVDEVAIFTSVLGSGQVQQLFTEATHGPIPIAVMLSNGSITLTWGAFAGISYAVQYKTNLAQPGWINLPAGVSVNGSTATATDLNPPDAQRFYRVITVP